MPHTTEIVVHSNFTLTVQYDILNHTFLIFEYYKTTTKSKVKSRSLHVNRGLTKTYMDPTHRISVLASCLIYAKPLGHPFFRAFIEYICGCVLFQDVTVREIRRR